MDYARMLLPAATAKKPYKRQVAYLEYPSGATMAQYSLSLGHKFGDCNRIEFDFRSFDTSAKDSFIGGSYYYTGFLGFESNSIFTLLLPQGSNVETIPQSFTPAIKGNGSWQTIVAMYDNTLARTTQNMPIGGYSSSAYTKSKQIAAIRLYLDSTMIANYISVLDWNDVPCMYDKVSRQLFYNQGSSEFLIDPADWRDDEVFTIDLAITDSNLQFGVTPYWNAGGWCNILDWGDGQSQAATTSGTALTHTYAEAGSYRVKVRGDMYRFRVGSTNPNALIDCNANWTALGTLTNGGDMFSNTHNFVGEIFALPDSLTSLSWMFANAYVCRLELTKLPLNATNFNYAFSSAQKLTADLDMLTANAPLAGWVDISSIDHMFWNCGRQNNPGTCTGSIAGFMRKFPNVSNVNLAFQYTNTTTFGASDYFEITLTTTEANQSWGFTATSSAGRWYCFDWGDGTAVTANKNLDVFTSGTKVSHTFATPGTYHIKLATAPCTIVFDEYDSDNGNWAALGQ